jgi:hypothetical protein
MADQGPDAAALAQEALRLLADYEGCEERWADADDDVLNGEIDQYRGSITAINKHLQTLGVAIDEDQDDDGELQEEQAGDQAPEQPGASAPAPEQQQQQQQQQQPVAEPEAAKEFAHLGEEGVDFTLGSVDDIDPSEWQVPPHCIPIHANVTTHDWRQLYEHTQFDVVMMDPPWQLATANPTRGVSLGYSQLNDNDIVNLPVPKLQSNGFLFVWVINAKYKFTLDLFDKWGYRWAQAQAVVQTYDWGGAAGSEADPAAGVLRLVASRATVQQAAAGGHAHSHAPAGWQPCCALEPTPCCCRRQAGGRGGVGQDDGQQEAGQEPRLLPAARQGGEGQGPVLRQGRGRAGT